MNKFGMSASKYTQIMIHNAFLDIDLDRFKVVSEHFADTYGGKPINYIKESQRGICLRIWPSMGKERKTSNA